MLPCGIKVRLVDPTQPLALTSTRTQHGPNTGQNRGWLYRFRIEREISPNLLNADHGSEAQEHIVKILLIMSYWKTWMSTVRKNGEEHTHSRPTTPGRRSCNKHHVSLNPEPPQSRKLRADIHIFILGRVFGSSFFTNKMFLRG